MKFTRAIRQQIVKEFAEQNGGCFDAALFLAHVREVGDAHPAWAWFEWDDDKAALEYRLDQARDFARGLKITFEIQEVHRGKMRITQKSAPLVISPLQSRSNGGGYLVTDPNSPEHLEELRRQAAQSLRWFISRFEGVLDPRAMGALEGVLAGLQPADHAEAA
jgi:hypothetical protein